MDIENMNIEKATERCKALTNPEQGCWIGISNQKAIETVLEELENKQDDINILQAQRDSMEYQFKQAKAELEKKDKEYEELTEASKELCKTVNLMKKVINEMSNFINLMSNELVVETGDNNLEFCKRQKCIDNRELDCEECIKEYFTKKVEGK